MNNIKQGSPEWHSMRLGKLTGSRFNDLMATTGDRPAVEAKPAQETVRDDDGNVVTRARKASPARPAVKGKPTARRANLIASLAIERMTGLPIEVFVNFAMNRGLELEPIARLAYEDHQMLTVNEVAFIDHKKHDFVGVSPDGLIGDDGMIEIKCPFAEAKHLGALLDGSHAEEYQWQIQGQLWVADRQWCHAVSYDPRYPEEHRLAITRVERDQALIDELEEACLVAEEEILDVIERVNNRDMS